MFLRVLSVSGGVALATALLGLPHMAVADQVCARVDSDAPVNRDTGNVCAPLQVNETVCSSYDVTWGGTVSAAVSACPPAPLAGPVP